MEQNERERDVVRAESWRPEKRDGAGWRGRSESESESESSYCEREEEGTSFVRRNSVKYCVRVVTIAPWVNDYWSHDPENITFNAVKISKDDPTTIRGQFDSGADTTVTNLLIYLHNYRPYTC